MGFVVILLATVKNRLDRVRAKGSNHAHAFTFSRVDTCVDSRKNLVPRQKLASDLRAQVVAHGEEIALVATGGIRRSVDIRRRCRIRRGWAGRIAIGDRAARITTTVRKAIRSVTPATREHTRQGHGQQSSTHSNQTYHVARGYT